MSKMLSITNLIQSIIGLFKGLPPDPEPLHNPGEIRVISNNPNLAFVNPNHRKPKMDTMYILSLLIPALSEIAHDAITAYYKLHGDQFAQPWASAPQEQKDATTAAVVNAVNGNPDTASAAGNLVNAVVTTAKSAIDLTIAAHQNQQSAPVVTGAQIGPSVTLAAVPEAIPTPDVIEHHDAQPAMQPIVSSAEWHPGADSPAAATTEAPK